MSEKSLSRKVSYVALLIIFDQIFQLILVNYQLYLLSRATKKHKIGVHESHRVADRAT